MSTFSTTAEAKSSHPASSGKAGTFVRRQFVIYGILPLLLIVLIATFAWIEPRFLSYGNLINVARQVSYLGIISLAQMLYLVTRNYDLSNGATVALSSVTCALVMTSTFPGQPAFAIAAALASVLVLGLIVGALNSTLIAIYKINSFMVTLGVGSAATGVALLVTGGVPVSGLPPEFGRYFGGTSVMGVPLPLILFVIVMFIVYVLLNWTRVGRQAYAVGGNDHAAYQAGVNVKKTLFTMMVLGSLFAAFVGVILTARISTGEANIGLQYPMQSIIACVIGGIALSGGEGRVSGTVMGALFIVLLSNGMDLIRVQSYVQDILLGALLILALLVDRLRARVRLKPA
jgi:ribose/xylose/arabinose/galactoside ABC-type transport system permease subunit